MRAVLVLVLLATASTALAQPSTHVTWLWHLEQPIYWPGPNGTGRHYQTAWDSLQALGGGAAHPENDLDEIFGKDDRVAVYQWRVRDAVEDLLGYAELGVQVSYSGGLVENVASLGAHNALGYTSAWDDPLRQARGWLTSGGNPRVDIVQFSFHHAFLPLLDPRVAQMELDLYRHVYPDVWGSSNVSTGLFPSEMAFAEHLIPVLEEAGIEWVVVSNHHLSRACADYPWVAGSGGDNIPPPNRADVQNPAQGYYNRISIDRGVSPANAVPFAYLPHWIRYVDPETGEESRVVAVPAAQSESWRDGYACFGVGDIDALDAHAHPTRPMLVLLAHDGDNAFGGGYSYYHECTPAFAGAAAAAGHTLTSVQDYLDDHAPPADDVVHVESGAWVNADGDFGAPSFLNWNWPLVNAAGQVDIAAGWAEDERNWAVITAATQIVLHATDRLGAPDLDEVHDPSPASSQLERAWHFLLGALNSGYMYYGLSLDMELKPSVACNQAVAFAQAAVAGVGGDTTPPTIWLPQRYPDNPGGLNFGPLYGYRQVTLGADFWVWTFAHDVSGIESASVWVREDADGQNPLDDDANETFDGGPGVGEWVEFPMTVRAFPAGDFFDLAEFSDEILPTVIADQYYAVVEGYRDVLLDYYVEAVDGEGNVGRSPILHVYVGEAGGGTGGGDPEGVHWSPAAPARVDHVTIYTPDDGWLHWGVNGWTLPEEGYWPAGTVAWSDGLAVETPLEGPDDDGFYWVELGPFASGADVDVIDFVIHRSNDTWDNNGGADYHIAVSEEPLGGDVGGDEPGDEPGGDEPPGGDGAGEDAGDEPGSDDVGGADAGVDAPDDAEDSTASPDATSSDAAGEQGGAGDVAGDVAADGDTETASPRAGDDGCGCGVGARDWQSGWWTALVLAVSWLVRRERRGTPRRRPARKARM